MDLEEGTVSVSKVGRPPDPDLATAVASGPSPSPLHMALALKMWLGKPMLWEQLLALTGVALGWRQIPGGWFGLGIFPCPKRRWNQLLDRALHGL